MTKIQRHCSSTLSLLAILYISTSVSLAQKPRESSPATNAIRTESTGDLGQTPIDLFGVLPASDALIVLDLKRVSSDALPRLLVDEQDARALVIALADPKRDQLLDP